MTTSAPAKQLRQAILVAARDVDAKAVRLQGGRPRPALQDPDHPRAQALGADRGRLRHQPRSVPPIPSAFEAKTTSSCASATRLPAGRGRRQPAKASKASGGSALVNRMTAAKTAVASDRKNDRRQRGERQRDPNGDRGGREPPWERRPRRGSAPGSLGAGSRSRPRQGRLGRDDRDRAAFCSQRRHQRERPADGDTAASRLANITRESASARAAQAPRSPAGRR